MEHGVALAIRPDESLDVEPGAGSATGDEAGAGNAVVLGTDQVVLGPVVEPDCNIGQVHHGAK